MLNRSKKSFLAVLALVLVLALALVGCGGAASSAAPSTAAPAAPAASAAPASSAAPAAPASTVAAGDITIALVPKVGVPFFDDCNNGGETMATELGVQYQWVVPEDAQGSTQVRIMEQLIAANVDGIAISVNEPQSVQAVIQQAVDAGIQVITFDSDASDSARALYIGTSNHQAGYDMGKAAAEQMGGSGKAAFITGQLGALNLNERIAGVEEALAEYPDIEIVGTPLGTDDDLTTAVSATEDLLRANPDLGCVFGVSQVGGPAVAKVLSSQEFADRQESLTVFAFDDLPDTVAGIRDGYIYGAMVQRPVTMGSLSVEVLYKLITGEEVELADIDTGCTVVTADNLDSYTK